MRILVVEDENKIASIKVVTADQERDIVAAKMENFFYRILGRR